MIFQALTPVETGIKRSENVVDIFSLRWFIQLGEGTMSVILAQLPRWTFYVMSGILTMRVSSVALRCWLTNCIKNEQTLLMLTCRTTGVSVISSQSPVPYTFAKPVCASAFNPLPPLPRSTWFTTRGWLIVISVYVK